MTWTPPVVPIPKAFLDRTAGGPGVPIPSLGHRSHRHLLPLVLMAPASKSPLRAKILGQNQKSARSRPKLVLGDELGRSIRGALAPLLAGGVWQS